MNRAGEAGSGQESARDEGRWWSLDVRSIAAFRVLLGVVILADLLYRAGDLAAFYTDAGIHPRGLGGSARFAFLHGLSGGLVWQVVLAIVHGALAVAVMLGVRTKLALAGCWLMLASMNQRNTWILQLADAVLVYWTIYALMLPCAERFALRPTPGNPGRDRVHSVATLLVIVQIVAIYESAGIHKALTETWTRGTLLIEAMRIDPVASDLGRHLLAWPALLRGATWGTLAVELLGPLVAVLSWRIGWLRTAICFVFIGFHVLGIALMMDLGLVAHALAIVWVLLLPSWFWDVGLPRLGVVRFARLRPSLASEASAAWSRRASLCVALVWGLAWWPELPASWGLPRAPAALDTALHVAGVRQYAFSLWTDPVGSRRWAFPARLRDGHEVDLLTGAALDWDALGRPKNNHWYKAFQKMQGNWDVVSMVTLYHVERWNAEHPPERRVERVSIVILWDEKMPADWWIEQSHPATARVPSHRITQADFRVEDRDGDVVLHRLPGTRGAEPADR